MGRSFNFIFILLTRKLRLRENQVIDSCKWLTWNFKLGFLVSKDCLCLLFPLLFLELGLTYVTKLAGNSLEVSLELLTDSAVIKDVSQHTWFLRPILSGDACLPYPSS